MITERVMDGSDVPHAADLAATFLAPLSARDWSRNVPGLDFTVASIVAHAAEGPLWYAADLTGDSGDDGTFEIRVRPGAEPVRLPGGAEQGGFGGGKSADKAVYAAVSQALAGPATWSLFPPVTSLACWAG